MVLMIQFLGLVLLRVIRQLWFVPPHGGIVAWLEYPPGVGAPWLLPQQLHWSRVQLVSAQQKKSFIGGLVVLQAVELFDTASGGGAEQTPHPLHSLMHACSPWVPDCPVQ
jgi:hypothetical protein